MPVRGACIFWFVWIVYIFVISYHYNYDTVRHCIYIGEYIRQSQWSNDIQRAVLSSAWTRIRHGFVFRSNFTISSYRQGTSSSQSPSTVQFQLIGASWLPTFNDAGRQAVQSQQTPEILNLFVVSDEFVKLYMRHFGEARRGPRGFVQRVKHSMTFWVNFWLVILVRLRIGHRRRGTRLKNKIFGVIDGTSEV